MCGQPYHIDDKLKDAQEAIAEIDAKDNFAFIQENLEHLMDNTENNNSICFSIKIAIIEWILAE